MTTPNIQAECNCFAVRQAARQITKMYEAHLAPLGLTAAQFTILGNLLRRPDIAVVDLAQAMVMERTTLVRALKPLQRDDLIVSVPADRDSRVRLFRLTARGRSTYDAAVVAWRAAQNAFDEKFGKARAKALRQELFDLTK